MPDALILLQNLIMVLLRVATFLSATVVVTSAGLAGTVRYELPELLGQHLCHGELFIAGLSNIHTPYNFSAIEQARIVVQGDVQAGLALGDGIIRAAEVFELKPGIGVTASFKHSAALGVDDLAGAFSLNETYAYPFVPETTPLPNLDGYPPVSFTVGLGLGPSLSTQFPPKIDPSPQYFQATDGVIVDQPIVAFVSVAFVELSGAEVVPEPSGMALVLAFSAIGFGTDTRRRRS
jgi:hypothetical protein